MPHAAKPLLLYVEDEILTQHVVEVTLQGAGYEVFIASDGHEAVQTLATLGLALCGLVTDVDLGDCPNGWEVAREARALLPSLPVVYVSGASAHDWGAMGVSDSVIVAKPFFPHQLVAAMAGVIARASRA